MIRETEFDIALSFAGEDRAYVDQVANILRSKGIKVFYDKFEEAELWGKNLYDYLSEIYSNKAIYTVMFVSEHYNKKLWTNHERQAMQNRAFQENQEYILPARFDNTEIPGLLKTIGYISLKGKTPAEFAEIICRKLVLSGRSIPSDAIRRSLSPMTKVPQANPNIISVTIENEKGEPVVGAEILLIAENNTFLKQNTSTKGKANFQIITRRSYKLFFAHSSYPSIIIESLDPLSDIKFTAHSSENVGSIVIENGTGYIPGLKGRLNPILDTSNRTYLYADNIAINGGEQQPATFLVNQAIDVEDCDGLIMQLTVKAMQGRSSLIEYVKPITE